MGVGAFLEPLVVVSLLIGGTLVNRERRRRASSDVRGTNRKRSDHVEAGLSSPVSDDGLLSPERRGPVPGGYLIRMEKDGWQKRRIGVLGWQSEVRSPETQQFSDRPLSRLLRAFPFLVEVWYWALIYWVYQLGRAVTAVTMAQGTVRTARKHALQLVHLERRLALFWEPAIQAYVLRYPTAMHWVNRIYSFIHIPGTILFLIALYYLAITANRAPQRHIIERSPAGPVLYQARRRTMAMCNLIAFVVFTAWPCMPPRLLSDPDYQGSDAEEAKSFGFVDTVHGADGESSVWTQNKFCNQYAAMPSLHFGYSLLIGMTVALIPLASSPGQARLLRIANVRIRVPSLRRLICVALGFAYPAKILLAIVATANHFILDAVAGAVVCGIAWKTERILLNLLPLEDWFMWCLRLHKPDVESDALAEWDEKKAFRPKETKR